jgi:hypothetical protein
MNDEAVRWIMAGAVDRDPPFGLLACDRSARMPSSNRSTGVVGNEGGDPLVDGIMEDIKCEDSEASEAYRLPGTDEFEVDLQRGVRSSRGRNLDRNIFNILIISHGKKRAPQN